MGEAIHQVFTGDTATLERSFDRIAKKLDDLATKSDQVGVKSKAASKGMDFAERLNPAALAMDRMVAGAAKLVTQFSAANIAFAALTKSQREQSELENKSVDSATRYARAVEQIGRNVKFDKASIAQSEGIISRISQKQGIGDAGFVADAFATALSEAPNDLKTAEGITNSAARWSARNPQDMSAVVGALGGLKRTYKDKSFDQLESFLGGVLEQSPNPNTALESQYILPLAGLSQQFAGKGANPETVGKESIAYAHALMRATGDRSGQLTSTAMLAVQSGLSKVFTENAELAAADPKTLRGRMEMLQGTGKTGAMQSVIEKATADLISGGIGEARAKSGVMGAIRGDYDDAIDKEIANLGFNDDTASRLTKFQQDNLSMRTAIRGGRREARGQERARRDTKALASADSVAAYTDFQEAHSREFGGMLGTLERGMNDTYVLGAKQFSPLQAAQWRVATAENEYNRLQKSWWADPSSINAGNLSDMKDAITDLKTAASELAKSSEAIRSANEEAKSRAAGSDVRSAR